MFQVSKYYVSSKYTNPESGDPLILKCHDDRAEVPKDMHHHLLFERSDVYLTRQFWPKGNITCLSCDLNGSELSGREKTKVDASQTSVLLRNDHMMYDDICSNT
uniref:Uncharacterized protein n=1 Tax=Glossina austeni TaxID=7395 RepID=A0A1A9VI16_GLOAU